MWPSRGAVPGKLAARFVHVSVAASYAHVSICEVLVLTKIVMNRPCAMSNVRGLAIWFVGKVVGNAWLHVCVSVSNSQVSKDQRKLASIPPKRTMTWLNGSYAHPVFVRFEGCVARLSCVHWSFVKLYVQVSPRTPREP